MFLTNLGIIVNFLCIYQLLKVSQGGAGEDELSRKLQESQTVRYLVNHHLLCQEDYCHPEAEVNLIITITGMWHQRYHKKVVFITVGIDETSGTGWFLARNLTSYIVTSGNEDYLYLGPIAWEYTYDFAFPSNDDVEIARVMPLQKNEKEWKMTSEDAVESERKESWKIGLSIGGESGFKFSFGYEWEYTDTKTMTTAYLLTMKEYEVVSGGSPNFAFVSYNRYHINHFQYMVQTPRKIKGTCTRYWDASKMDPLVHSGCVPTFAVTVEASAMYGKKQQTEFTVAAKVGRIVATRDSKRGACESPIYKEEPNAPWQSFKKSITIYWGHPVFSRFLSVLIQTVGYTPPKSPNNICLEATNDLTVFLGDCSKFDNRKVYSWIHDDKGRLQWFSKNLENVMCLSTNMAATQNLFIEECSESNMNQRWDIVHDSLRNIEGNVFVDSHGAPYVSKPSDSHKKTNWRFNSEDGPPVYLADAFEYEEAIIH